MVNCFRFCCDDRPTAVLISDSNQALVHFKSASESHSSSKEGFKIAYKIGKFSN